MHARTRLPEPLRRLLLAQAGVLSRKQLFDAGVSPGQLRGLIADWTRLAPGIYLASPTYLTPTFTARAWAGVLLGGEGARLGGLSAALLHSLADPLPRGDTLSAAYGPSAPSYRACGSRTDPAAVIQVWTPGSSRRQAAGFEIHRERPGVRLPSRGADPPRLHIDDTVLDLCAQGEPEEAITWLTRACQRRLTTTVRLQGRLEQRPTLRHRRLIAEVLSDVAAGATSQLERRALTAVLRPHGLTGARMQARTGSRGRIADAAFEQARVFVEFDGRMGHVEEGAWRDRERDNAHARGGWLTLRFGWWEVTHDPCGVAAQIIAVLIERGWQGAAARCPLCRDAVPVSRYA